MVGGWEGGLAREEGRGRSMGSLGMKSAIS